MRLAVLGDPVAHSKSPAIHQAALDHLGIDGTYEAIRVDAAGMAAAVADVRSGRLDGANVTMPHKRRAAELCDRLSGGAKRAAAANTLVGGGGDVVGHLTDVAGVERCFEWAGLDRDGPVLVLGSGGAAAAALLALETRTLWVAARRRHRAVRLVADLGVVARTVDWGTPVPGATIVNATPIGMKGEELPGAMLAVATGLLDMAYGSGATPAAEDVRSRGLPVAHGIDMLLGQATASFELWTGQEAPEEVMRAALV